MRQSSDMPQRQRPSNSCRIEPPVWLARHPVHRLMDLERREGLRALAEAATPGPWQWWGNVDYPGRIDLATVGFGTTIVMGFHRAGMQGAEPHFYNRDPDEARDKGWLSGTYVKARDCAVKQVDYRGDIRYLDNADAKWIAAASPDMVLALLDRIEELEADRDSHEHPAVTVRRLEGPT